jgi:hypothetical protein
VEVSVNCNTPDFLRHLSLHSKARTSEGGPAAGVDDPTGLNLA